ncbi:hypothetical protein D9757_011205 [Collybiopsis confluens]|uniref:HAT C-terminal dimerisation domain-containing protein n=1 Tax=Collybiopsis confluens TaxID=2823264 RepID=A0A8H5H366_9AGAR|nr:hypothetical protein D9757_011205 [Collybiopsis confluens]
MQPKMQLQLGVVGRVLSDNFLDSKVCLSRYYCLVGLNQYEYPILSYMARDYLAVPGSAAAVERTFSGAGLTDVERRARIGDELFGELQELKEAYKDGRMSARDEAWLHVEPTFD